MSRGHRGAARALAAVASLSLAAAAAGAGAGLTPIWLLDAASAELSRGAAAEAVEAYERVTSTGHDLRGELGLVRARMQAGEYRRALAFGAHARGEHIDAAGAGVLYAWLLHVGGQVDASAKVMAEVLSRQPLDPLAQSAARALASPLPQAEPALLADPHRIAPVPTRLAGSAVADDARVVSSGVLVDAGHAIVPRSVLERGAKKLWVRDGLGRTVEVEALPGAAPGEPLAMLRLAAPLPLPAGAPPPRTSDRPPFAGSPGFVFEYGESASAAPAWPQLRPGFVGAREPSGQLRLGIAVHAPALGGPVLDGTGALAGIAVRGDDGRAMLIPASSWRSTPPRAGEAEAVPAQRPRIPMPMDELYERGLQLALQVIASP